MKQEATMQELKKKLEEIVLIIATIVIASIVVPLLVITFPLWLVLTMSLRMLTERYPSVSRALQRLGVTLK